MRKSKTLAKVRAGQPVRLCSLGHFIPAYAGLAAHYGFDCIWLDAEHRAWNDREIQAFLAACQLHDIDCMLRPPTLEKTRLYRFLEDGATGLLIPHVSTAEKARLLVDAVKFPPVGDRGLDGSGLDSDYALADVESYIDHTLAETFLVVQIETPEAVGNVAEIAAVKGLDGMFIGSGDLGLRIRRTETSLTLDAAFEEVAAAAKQNSIAWGAPGLSHEHVGQLQAAGAQLIAYGGDFRAVEQMLRERAEELDAWYGPRS